MSITFTNATTSNISNSIIDPGNAGDLLLLFTMDDWNNTETYDPPAGTWTQITQQYAPFDAGNFTVWWGTSAGGGGTLTVTPHNIPFPQILGCLAYSGCDMVNPINASTVNNPGSITQTVSNAGVTPTVTSTQLVYIIAMDVGTSANYTFTVPSSPGTWASRMNSLSSFSALAATDASYAPATATGSISATMNNGTNDSAWVNLLIALAPAGGLAGISIPTYSSYITL